MSLAGHSPPPIFNRGLAPRARLFILSMICVAMLVADLRFSYLEVVRQVVTVLLHPLQRAAAAPVDFARNAAVYFATLVDVQLENAELRRSQVDAAQRLLRFEQLERENAELRALAGLAQAVPLRGVGAEILYDAPDPFSRKVILDKGDHHGVRAGQAVVDARGLIGQVSRVYPVQSEVTLLTDREQVVPVKVERTGMRGILSGSGDGALAMRFVQVGSDVQPGDRLVTSGLDGLFVAGLPVATVSEVTVTGGPHLQVVCAPIARVERAVQVLVLGPDEPLPRRPEASQALPLTPAAESGAP